MDSNISELVKSGHEIASELKASCGAVDVRSVAQLISDLATQLDVQLVRSNALAAENAGLKNVFGPGDAVLNFLTIALRHTTYDQIDLDDVTLAFRMSLPETPATDAFLAEVRAAAVDEVCLKISNAIVNCYQDEQVGLDAAATICGDFAAQIRKGVQS
ncbi:hypothetical protein [Citrobacter sedlakii]|uniref:hypothetical protein n=1 Tax=Citrobacter sedlakii TaxID=67826 RepID=UPI00333AD821